MGVTPRIISKKSTKLRERANRLLEKAEKLEQEGK